MTALERAQAVHEATMKRFAGKRATYARGSSSVVIVAVPGRTDAEVVNEQQLATRVQVDDWFVDVGALVLDGTPVEPRSGDSLTVDGIAYRVFDLGVEGAYRFTGQSRSQFRIHTQRAS